MFSLESIIKIMRRRSEVIKRECGLTLFSGSQVDDILLHLPAGLLHHILPIQERTLVGTLCKYAQVVSINYFIYL